MWYVGIGLGVLAAVLAAVDLAVVIYRRRKARSNRPTVSADVVSARPSVGA
jgi:hypothetical protein